jgi:hypothetical protein
LQAVVLTFTSRMVLTAHLSLQDQRNELFNSIITSKRIGVSLMFTVYPLERGLKGQNMTNDTPAHYSISLSNKFRLKKKAALR